MKAELKSQLKDAMRAKEQVKMDLIRGLLSAIQYDEIQAGVDDLDPAGILAVLKRELKKKQEEIEFAEKAGRQEVVDQAKKGLAMIESFLPKQMNASDLEARINDFVKATPGTNMGAVMKFLKEKYDGQYDGRSASELVKKVLG